MDIKAHIEKQAYDRWYQDVECIGHVGYAKSFKSWENIKDMVYWEGLRVLDIGCFHGYFCFKVLEAGAKNVVGIDKRSDVLATTRLIAEEIKAYNCDFFTLTANQLGDFAKDKYDVVLVMNVFHHIADQDAFFNSFHSEQPFIMEIDKEDLTKVKKHCIIIQEKPSHRASFHTGDTPNRLVILAEKR